MSFRSLLILVAVVEMWHCSGVSIVVKVYIASFSAAKCMYGDAQVGGPG